MIAQCAFGAHNALTSRHLLPPANRVVAKNFNFFLSPCVKPFLQAYYAQSWLSVTDWDLESGRTAAKRQLIYHSRAFDHPRYDRATSFPKREVNSGEPRKARLIQAQVSESSAYNHDREYYAVLKALGCLGDHEFLLHGVKCTFVYAGGHNHDSLSDLVSVWLAEPGVFCIDERDGKNWDATMQLETLTAEYDIYASLGMYAAQDVRRRFQEVVGRILVKYGKTRIKMKYKTMYKRLSGDWNTTAGNTIISMMVVYHTLGQLPEHLRPTKVQALFMGDDYWAKYTFNKLPNLCDLHAALDFFDSQMGITPERGIFLDPLATTFISLTLWPRKVGGYQFVPKPAKQLRKLFWSPKRVSPRHRQMIVNGMCICLWPVYQGFELMQKFLKHHYVPAAGHLKYDHFFGSMFTKVGRDVDWGGGFLSKYSVPFQATRFDLPPGYWVAYHPVIDIMLREEEADPKDRPGAC